MRQSLRMLARDWRAGELRVLAAALVVAVAALTSVAFFADRLSQALLRDAHQLLGADLVLRSDHPWRQEIIEKVQRSGLQSAEAMNFISMAMSGARSELSGVKAVTDNYPLRGRLRVAPAPGAPDAPVERGPEPGTVWLEERLVTALGAPVGSSVRLGRAELRVAAVLTLEPERTANFFNIAPRLMMNLADVPATTLVQPGSRVWYYVYAAGPLHQVRQFESDVEKLLERGQRAENLETGRPEVRASIDRAERFLGLTALLAAILAGVAIALGTRRFVERHLDGCAVMRCLGASQGTITALYGLEFLMLGLAACAVGTGIGFFAQGAIATALGELLKSELPAPSALPALQGFLVGLVLLLGFAVPPLVQLKNVPAVRVMRRESTAGPGTLLTYAAGIGAFAGLLVWQAGDLKLGLTVVGGFAAAVLAFFAVAWGALRLLTHRRVTRLFGRRLRYGLANLRRHARGNAVQVASLALGLTAVLLLSFTRNDLVDAWRRSAPPDAPNRFLVGVQPDQRIPVEELLKEKGVDVELY
ncbi:MAG TPA: FtsX-like permease family protein, partial [Burkholderiales bacterium]|nr:FtsX-like permease family protein [Burkholderiales bacterium]